VQNNLGGVWSASPTPLNEHFTILIEDVSRLLGHHRRLGVNGLFLCGTNGEGPWLPGRARFNLIREVARNVGGDMPIAVQVTDNSSMRIVDNMVAAADAGADIAVIAPPDFFFNASADTLTRHYMDAIDHSPLPVGIYDRGPHGTVEVPLETLKKVYSHEKVILIKDSAVDLEHKKAAIEARKNRPELSLLNGYEFDCVTYLEDGYDGLLLGGGVFNGYLARKLMEAVRGDDIKTAEQLQKRMNNLMWDVYGGKDISCWLAGEKYLLMQLGVLTSLVNYPRYELTESCKKSIEQALKRDNDYLLPTEK
jgi:4-hydroxy-tetrahydrodipicolinate synthase